MSVDLVPHSEPPVRNLPTAALNVAMLAGLDSFVVANGPTGLPVADIRSWVQGGGTLILTDKAGTLMEDLGVVPDGSVAMHKAYVGFVDFANRTDPLNQGLRGVASQTFDT